MTSFSQKEMIEEIAKLKNQTKENTALLTDIYTKILEMAEADKRNQAALNKMNEVLVTINKEKTQQELLQQQLDTCKAELDSYKEQMVQHREILLQLEIKYFTDVVTLQKKVEDQDNLLEEQENKICKLKDTQKEMDGNFIHLQQNQSKNFNEFKPVKFQIRNLKKLLNQHKSESKDDIKRQITERFLEFQKQTKQSSEINDISAQIANQQTIKEIMEIKIKIASFQVEISKILELKQLQSENSNENVVPKSQISEQKEVIKNQISERDLSLQKHVSLQLKDLKAQTDIQNICLQQQKMELNYFKTELYKLANTLNIYKGISSLHLACEYGLLDVVTELIKEGANINVVTNKNTTPLHLACEYGRTDVAFELLNKGAEVNSLTNGHMTSLHIACKYGLNGLVIELLNHGADVNIINTELITPLHLACTKDFGLVSRSNIILKNGNDVSAVVELINKGANVNCRTNVGWTPLHFAAQSSYELIVHELLKHPMVDVHCTTINGNSALHLAAKSGSMSIVAELVKFGVDVNCKNKCGVTPLHFSAQRGHASVVTTLLNHGATVACKTINGQNSLHIATINGHVLVLITLLKRGADIFCKDNLGKTALDLATEMGKTEIINVLKLHEKP